METDNRELRELASLYCDEALSPEQVERLHEILRDDVDARRVFLGYVDIHARLSWEFGADTSQDLRVSTEDILAEQQSRGLIGPRRSLVEAVACRLGSRSRLALASFLVTVALALTILFVQQQFARTQMAPTGGSTHQASPATLVKGVAVRWKGSVDYRVDDDISSGPLELLAGLAVLKTANGSQILMEAPVSLELIDAGNAFLHSGRVVVRCDKTDQFVIDTARVKVTDKGTEFGVSMGPSGDTMIQVFEGRVLADFKNSTDGVEQSVQLIAGEAYGIPSQLDSQPHKLAFTPEFFVRIFPEPDGQSDFEMAFQTSARVESVYIVTAPNGVVIDGDLSDWNLSGQFEGTFDPPYEDAYNMRGYMMYDQENLYIGAHVQDPAPLRSIVTPGADNRYCYRGGGVQVRICTDPAEPWPSPKYYWPRRIPHVDADARPDSFVHLSMWYYAPEDQPCLDIAVGFPPLESLSGLTKQWRGAYKPDPDGMGYTLEYAISWRAIQNDEMQRFKAGDETAVCWQVNWSNREGRVRLAQLSECVNLDNIHTPEDLAQCWRQSASWGRGIFLDTGENPVP